MPIRQFADINQTSDAFGGGTNAGMNRHEEFRLERNREFHSQPKKTDLETLREASREIKDRMAAVVQRQQLNGTSFSTNGIRHANRIYVLPPVDKQPLHSIGEAKVIDSQLGGLGFHQHMYDLFAKTSKTVASINGDIAIYNAKLAKKSNSLFGKKKNAPPPLVGVHLDRIVDAFNEKLAAARIPVEVGYFQNMTAVFHPSSASGNPERELHDWSETRWRGVPERPWDNFLIELPAAPPSK